MLILDAAQQCFLYMCGLVTITLAFTVRPHVHFTFVSLSNTYFTLKNKQTINIQPRNLIYVKRPYRSFIYFHLVRQWCATGRHPGGFTCWLRPCPGWLTRFLCLTPSNAASAAAVIQPNVTQSSSEHRLAAPGVLLY